MTQDRIFTEKELADMVKALYCGDIEKHINTMKTFRTVIRKCKKVEDNASIEEIIQTGIIPRLVEFLQMDKNPQLQTKTLKVLRALASGITEQTKAVVDAGAVPTLIKLLSADDDDVQENAVLVLGNIAGDCAEYRDLLLDTKIVDPLIVLLLKPFTKTVLWAICNLCRGRAPPPDYSQVSQFLGPVTFLTVFKDADILADVCWSLVYLSDGPTDNIERVLKTGIAEQIVEFLTHESERVVIAALRIVGNICMGNDDQIQVMIDLPVLPTLLLLLSSSKKSIRRNTCWVISNITAGNQSRIQAVRDAGIFPVLIDILTNDNLRIKTEAVWSIVNVAVLGTPNQVRHLVRHGCIPPLCDFLIVDDIEITREVLNGLKHILRLGDREALFVGRNNIYVFMIEDCFGLEKIDYLQLSDDEDICQQARDLITRYFSIEDAIEGENVDDDSEQKKEMGDDESSGE